MLICDITINSIIERNKAAKPSPLVDSDGVTGVRSSVTTCELFRPSIDVIPLFVMIVIWPM